MCINEGSTQTEEERRAENIWLWDFPHGPVGESALQWWGGGDMDFIPSQGTKEKRASEDKMAGQHPWCNEHELGQSPGDGEGQGGLVCCCLWGPKESDPTGQQQGTKILQATPRESVCGNQRSPGPQLRLQTVKKIKFCCFFNYVGSF